MCAIHSLLLQKFSGSLEAMIQSANGDAWSLVEVVASSFTSYHDVTSYKGQTVSFLKRAQLFVSDLCHELGGKGFGALSGIEKLTMFADYRVPQVSTKSTSKLVFLYYLNVRICFPNDCLNLVIQHSFVHWLCCRKGSRLLG